MCYRVQSSFSPAKSIIHTYRPNDRIMKDSFERFLQTLFELRARKASLFMGTANDKVVENLQYSEHFYDEAAGCYVRVSYRDGLKTIHLDSIECEDKGNGWFTSLLKVAKMNCEQLIIENVINERLVGFLTKNGFVGQAHMCWVWRASD